MIESGHSFSAGKRETIVPLLKKSFEPSKFPKKKPWAYIYSMLIISYIYFDFLYWTKDEAIPTSPPVPWVHNEIINAWDRINSTFIFNLYKYILKWAFPFIVVVHAFDSFRGHYLPRTHTLSRRKPSLYSLQNQIKFIILPYNLTSFQFKRTYIYIG